ncbi:MAG: hypothetical protein ACLS8R_02870 [Anaeromassilibacillus sp.]
MSGGAVRIYPSNAGGIALGDYLLYRHNLLNQFLCYINRSDNELEQVERIEHFIDERTIRNIAIFWKAPCKSDHLRFLSSSCYNNFTGNGFVNGLLFPFLVRWEGMEPWSIVQESYFDKVLCL